MDKTILIEGFGKGFDKIEKYRVQTEETSKALRASIESGTPVSVALKYLDYRGPFELRLLKDRKSVV